MPTFRGIRKKYEGFRRKYPEGHGKVVDFITQSIEDGPLYFSVGFADKTDFSFRYACEMFVVGADFSVLSLCVPSRHAVHCDRGESIGPRQTLIDDSLEVYKQLT